MAWDTSISDATWLQPKESPLDALVKGVSAGASIAHNMLQRSQMEQQAREFDATMGLRVQQQELDNKKSLVNIAGQQIQNQLGEFQLQDDMTWKDSMARLAVGEKVEPSFNSPANSVRWQQFNADTELGKNAALYRAAVTKSVADELDGLKSLQAYSDLPLGTLEKDASGLPFVKKNTAALDQALKRKAEQDALKKKETLQPADVRLAEWRSGAIDKMNEAKAQGDDATATTLQSQIDFVDAKNSKGMRVSFDEDKNPIIEIGGKAPLPAGASTNSTNSRNQQKLAKYENTTELLANLEKNLTPGDVGAAGVVGEMVMDRTLSQIPGLAGMANNGRIANRTALKVARESLMRDISDDTRFSNKDREDIGAALPENGVFESYPNALQRIKTVRDILSSRGKVYSSQMGLKTPPAWTMSPEEIKAAVQNKSMTMDQATEALRRFHGFQ